MLSSERVEQEVKALTNQLDEARAHCHRLEGALQLATHLHATALLEEAKADRQLQEAATDVQVATGAASRLAELARANPALQQALNNGGLTPDQLPSDRGGDGNV